MVNDNEAEDLEARAVPTRRRAMDGSHAVMHRGTKVGNG